MDDRKDTIAALLEEMSNRAEEMLHNTNGLKDIIRNWDILHIPHEKAAYQRMHELKVRIDLMIDLISSGALPTKEVR